MDPSGLPFLGVDALLPVPTGGEAADFDARAQARHGIAGGVLMESAGRAAASVVERLLRTRLPSSAGGPVVVLAGAGKNGGDGVVLARTLQARGRRVHLFLHPDRASEDPLLHGHLLPVELLPGSPAGLPALLDARAPVLVVDALLGTGPTSAPREPVAGWVEALRSWVEARSVPVVALDLPTGVVANTGAVPGAVLPATWTLAFGAPKLGTLLHPGRGVAGSLVVLEIGFPPWMPGDAGAALLTPGWARAHLPARPLDTHKNAVGRLLLLAGGEGMAGAALLAARGALRTGVGMLRVVCHPGHRALLLDPLPEAIVLDPDDDEALGEALATSDAVVAGPGMGLDPGTGPARALLHILSRWQETRGSEARGLLLDADALTLLGRGDLGQTFPVAPSRLLLTPHPGEMARILPPEGGESGTEGHGWAGNRAREGARRWKGACLLKGAPSLVAGAGSEEGAPLLLSASGGSAFARGGMGDVLAGVAGALLARGCTARVAGGLALHLTGEAAEASGKGPNSLLPSDLVAGLPPVIEACAEPAPEPAPLPPEVDPAVLHFLPAPR